MLQYRPMEGTIPDRLYYSPARDLANCGIDLITTAMQMLEKDINAGKFTFNDFTIEELETAVEKLGKAVSSILEKTDKEALIESGFLDSNPAIIDVIYSYIGKVLIYAVYVAVKDVHCPDSKPPLSVETFLEEVKEYHNHVLIRIGARKINRLAGVVKKFFLKIYNAIRESLDALTDLILNTGNEK